MKHVALYILFSLALAFPASALTLEACNRTTHNAHAGEARHQVFDGGRVAWVDWWSNEGVYNDLVVMDCETGDFLKARTLDEGITDRWFNRRTQALEVLASHMKVAPSLFTFTGLADALKGNGRNIEIASATAESCACAAVHPELRGSKTAFELEE